MSIVRGIFTSDWHVPDIDKKAYAAAARTIKAVGKIDYLILGGDIFDFQTLSIKYLHMLDSVGSDVRKQVERGKRLIEPLMADAAETVWMDGNHEDRPDKMLRARASPLSGFFDFHRDVLRLQDLGIKRVIRYENGNGAFHIGQSYGGLALVHGWIGSKSTPGATARAHAQALDSSVVHGHSHECETSQIPLPRRILWCCSAGGLFDKNALKRQYAVYPKWQNGLAYFEVEDGSVRRVVSIPIIDGRAHFDGEII